MDQDWENWNYVAHLKYVVVLPLLVIWGIWLARNNLIFSEKTCTPAILETLACGILTSFTQHIRAVK